MIENGEILLAEHRQDDIDFMLRTLRREKLSSHIAVARDGVEALDYIYCRGAHAGRSNIPPPLIVLDLKLPKAGGIEVLRQIKGDPMTRMIPVVILATSGEERELQRSYELGANSCIHKPVETDQFRQVIKSAGLYWLVTNQPPVAAQAGKQRA